MYKTNAETQTRNKVSNGGTGRRQKQRTMGEVIANRDLIAGESPVQDRANFPASRPNIELRFELPGAQGEPGACLHPGPGRTRDRCMPGTRVYPGPGPVRSLLDRFKATEHQTTGEHATRAFPAVPQALFVRRIARLTDLRTTSM